jgi:DNA-binding SARP family transcriptional activator
MHVRILGPLAVERDGTELDLGAPKQRAVLAFLAAHAGEPVSLDRLIDELWGDQAPPRATASLQAYVSNLRRVLEPGRRARTPAALLVSRPPGYALDLPEGALDADRFERLAAAAAEAKRDGDVVAALDAADAALALWRGEVLADFPYEPFTEAIRLRLDERRLEVLELRSEALLAGGRAAEAATALEELTRRHPLREHLWELLMLARYRSGRQADALRAYGEARAVLTEELGLEPGPALRRLEQQILAHDPALSPGDGPGPAPVAASVAASVGPAVTGPPLDPDRGRSAGPGTRPTGSGPVLVGRRPELAVLEEAWRAAVAGCPAFAAVAGEPGIGKTTLVQALQATAEAGGGRVVWGRNHEQAGSAPLWPWMQIVRELTVALESDGRALAPDAAAVLAPVLDGTGTAAAGDVDAARLHLYDAVHRLLRAVSEDRPVLVVLDDAQWADVDSLRLLDYLSNELTGGRVLVVLTYREEEARPGTPVAAALGALSRRGDTARLTLRGLPPDAVAELARRVSGLDLEPGTVELLAGRTSGNPFFLAEMIRLLSAERRLRPADAAVMEVPSGVRDVVRRRVDRLPEDSQAVLHVAAVMGREFTVDELAEACALDVEPLLDALDPPLVTALVEEVDARGETFRFSHALVGEALVDDLSPTRRRRLHARIGLALERVHRRDLDAQSSRLAHHFAEAAALGHASTATRYAVRAARRAHARVALDEAARLWRLALDVAAIDDDADPREVTDITIELASALARIGDAEARATSAEALDRALALGDPDTVVRAATSLTEHTMTWISAEFRQPEEAVVSRLEAALELLGPEDSARRARVLSVLAPLGYYRDPGRADRVVDEAVAVARRLGDDRLLASCLVQRLCVHHSDNRDALASAEELLDVGRRLGDPALEACALVSQVRARFALGDVEGADADAARARAVLARHPAPLLELQLSYHPVLRLVLDGHLDDADEAALAIERRGQRVSMWGNEHYLIQAFDIRFFQGRLAEIEPVLDLLTGSDLTARNYAALVRFEDGRHDEGVDLLERWGGIGRPADDWRFPAEAVTAALLAHHVGDATVAAELYPRLRPRAGELATSGDLNCEGPVDTYLGLLAATYGDRALARRHLEAAVEQARSLGSPTFEAHARVHLAELCEGAERDEHRDRALALAADVGMAAVAARARRLGERPAPR